MQRRWKQRVANRVAMEKMVGFSEVPPGGMKNSPAYRLLVSRNGGVKPPPPEKRAGAPVKGGFPLSKLPPNVLVDVQRRYWLPDDWGQVIKNTGPGGTYIIWLSPEGKFFYHHRGYPSAIEETLGRELTAKDGFNGILRSAKQLLKLNADKIFLRDCLTSAEKKTSFPLTNSTLESYRPGGQLSTAEYMISWW